MNKSESRRTAPSLKAIVVAELKVYLEQTPVGSEFKVEPSADLCFSLELYIPQLLSRRYKQWQYESLDGIFPIRARRMSVNTAEIGGLCILISDQTLTPFFIRFSLDAARDSIKGYRILLGEPGGGTLGISGPPCNSSKAQILLYTIGVRMDSIHWSYSVKSATF
ncbi:hypothetical protein [Deinococcus sp.]|uniref:hypothetical protein n=1 Tax=Deinococcus sp. TaxID=47478 RepID=UPI003CC6B4E2